jgi:DNA-binding transcriptional regulator GbsR (MarR family)
VQAGVVDLFVQVSRSLGQPRSVAEIYGLLFISPRPLAMDDLIGCLNLSKGSASQGLRFLRALGAVRSVYVAGDRRDHYEAVTELRRMVSQSELRRMVSQFLRARITPHLDSGEARLDQIEEALGQLPEAEREWMSRRINTLRVWGRNGRRFLPLVEKILE